MLLFQRMKTIDNWETLVPTAIQLVSLKLACLQGILACLNQYNSSQVALAHSRAPEGGF